MASLYSISNELQDIIFQLEEGEVTDELLEKLALSEEGLKEKIKSYIDVIKKYQAEERECKDEKDRVNKIQKTKTNTYTRLKQVVLDAVLQFGTINKSGNRSIEGSTFKVYTKVSPTIELDDLLIADIIRLYFDIVGEYISSTDTVEELDLDYIAAIITKYLIAESKARDEAEVQLDDVRSFTGVITKDDFIAITTNVSINISLADLHNVENLPLLSWIRQHPHKCNVVSDINKTEIKEHLALNADLHICKVENNVSLIIK